jgi:Carboxypeptidase regulatory-like domain
VVTLRVFFFAIAMSAPLLGGSIEGRVTNSVTGEPVIDASVRFIGAHSVVFSTATDSTGTYHLTGLDDGDYHGEFSKDGFSGPPTNSVAFMLSGAGVAHVAGDTPVRKDAQLQPWGGLRGRVMDEDGTPAAGVEVEISRSVDNSAITDQNGAFAFQEVAPGAYTVVARPKPETPKNQTETREGERLGAVPIYYPSATEPADAVSIPVRWGEDVAGIEIRLKSVPVHRVTGVVLDPEGKPAPQAEVRLLGRPGGRQYLGGVNVGTAHPIVGSRAPAGLSQQQALAWMLTTFASGGWVAGPGPEAEVMKVETGEDGKFAFETVEPGDWRVSAVANEDSAKQLTGVASATVSEQDVEGVEVRLGGPVYVDVTADWGEDGVKDHPSTTMVSLAPLDGQPPFYFDKSQMPPEIFAALPGRYRVIGGSERAPGYYVSSVTLGGAEVLGMVVELAQGSGPFRVTFKHDAGSVRGSAEKGEGASVFLVSNEPGELVNVREAKCGAEGAFEFSNVPPGDYYVVAFDRLPEGNGLGSALPAKDLPVSIVSMATSVRVDASSEARVNIRVNP